MKLRKLLSLSIAAILLCFTGCVNKNTLSKHEPITILAPYLECDRLVDLPDICTQIVYDPNIDDVSDKMIDLSGYDFTDNYVESRLQEIQTMFRPQTEEKHQSLVIHHSLTVGMNAHISKSVEMKVLEKTISSIKFWGLKRRLLNNKDEI